MVLFNLFDKVLVHELNLGQSATDLRIKTTNNFVESSRNNAKELRFINLIVVLIQIFFQTFGWCR